MSNKFKLRLYITGNTPRSAKALQNLKELCDGELKGLYNLEVIDVLERPQLAEEERILATPTLIKDVPPPLRRIIGDLSDKEKVLIGLDVRVIKSAEEEKQ